MWNAFTDLRHPCLQVLPPGTDIPAAFAGGSDEEQAFVQNLALFLTSFFRVRAPHCDLGFRVDT